MVPHSYFWDSLFLILFFLSFVVGALLYARLSSWSMVERFIAASLPTAILIFIAILTREFLEAPFQIWNNIRLLPAFMATAGLPLYFPRDTGPVLDMMYGPFNAYAYVPVALLTKDPTLVSEIAKCFTILYYFGPVLWLTCHKLPKELRQWVIALYVFLFFAYYSYDSQALIGSAFSNHADAPALGFSATACIFLFYRKHKEAWGPLWASALFATMAIWTKQVTLPLLFALPFCLWLMEDGRYLGRYLFCLIVTLCLSTVLFCRMYGTETLWFNLIINPMHQPWEESLFKVQGRALVELLQRMRWISLVTFFYLAYEWRALQRYPISRFEWFSRNRWIMFTIVGIFMIPTSIIGRLKIGGALNALSFTIYFLIVGVGLLFLKILLARSESGAYRWTQMMIKCGVVFAVLSSMTINTPSLTYYFLFLKKNIVELSSTPGKNACLFLEEHPNEVYLPWNTLSHFLAEKKLYHFDYAISDRDASGFPLTPEHFQAHLPSKMRWVAFPPMTQDEYVMKYLPEFSQRGTLPELPGWIVYSRPEKP